MNYKDAYYHLLRTLGELIARLDQPQATCSPCETVARLRCMAAESEEIRKGQRPYPVHKASRHGSSTR